MPAARAASPLRVTLVALPEGSISTLHGIYDVLGSFRMLGGFDDAIPASPPFRVEIAGAAAGPVALASGLTAQVERGVAEIRDTDIVIVPSVVLPRAGCGRAATRSSSTGWRGCTRAARPSAPRARGSS